MMRCQFCGKEADKLTCGPNDVTLCEGCYTIYKKNMEARRMGEVIGMNQKSQEAGEALQEEQKEEVPIQCEITVGILANGRIYFEIDGDEPNMLVIDGLIKYADRMMKQQWDYRDMLIAQAKAADAAKEEKTE